MTWPSVIVSQINRFNGTTTDVERVVLCVGHGETNTGKTQAINSGTDLDVALGTGDSLLKKIVMAASNNAGQNWFAYVHVLPVSTTDEDGEADPDDDWMQAVKEAQNVAFPSRATWNPLFKVMTTTTETRMTLIRALPNSTIPCGPKMRVKPDFGFRRDTFGAIRFRTKLGMFCNTMSPARTPSSR